MPSGGRDWLVVLVYSDVEDKNFTLLNVGDSIDISRLSQSKQSSCGILVEVVGKE